MLKVKVILRLQLHTLLRSLRSTPFQLNVHQADTSCVYVRKLALSCRSGFLQHASDSEVQTNQC